MTELAVCLPLLTLVVFGSIQACNLIYLKHGCVTAAYEGTLELAKRNATSASITSRVQQVLTARGIRSSQIRILPAGTDISTRGPGNALHARGDGRPCGRTCRSSGFFPTPQSVTGRIAATR